MVGSIRVLLSSDFHVNVYSWRREIIDDLIDQGAKVSIAVPYGEKLEYFKSRRCKLYDINLDRSSLGIINNIILLIQYYKTLSIEKPDIVLLYGSKSMLYPGIICRIKGIKYIANVNGFGTVESMNSIVKNIIFTLYKMVIPYASCVFFQNEYNFHKFTEMNIISNNNCLIPGSGVNLEKYDILEYPDGDRVTFLFCARLIQEKGIFHFLEAAKILKTEGINAEFDIIGMGDSGIIEKVLENHDIVNYHGFQSNVKQFIKKAHCIVLPSYYGEGISNSLLESAASGRPIITTDMPGCRETVKHGETGYIIKPKNTYDLVMAMKKFIKLSITERITMGKKARNYIENNFDRKIVEKAYLREIKKALEMEE